MERRTPEPQPNHVQPLRNGTWTAHEHQLFLQALDTCETRDYLAMAKFIGSRNAGQVRSHAQKFNNRLRNHQERVENQLRVEDTLDDNGQPMVSTRIRNGIPLQRVFPPIVNENDGLEQMQRRKKRDKAREMKRKQQRKMAKQRQQQQQLVEEPVAEVEVKIEEPEPDYQQGALTIRRLYDCKADVVMDEVKEMRESTLREEHKKKLIQRAQELESRRGLRSAGNEPTSNSLFPPPTPTASAVPQLTTTPNLPDLMDSFHNQWSETVPSFQPMFQPRQSDPLPPFAPWLHYNQNQTSYYQSPFQPPQHMAPYIQPAYQGFCYPPFYNYGPQIPSQNTSGFIGQSPSNSHWLLNPPLQSQPERRLPQTESQAGQNPRQAGVESVGPNRPVVPIKLLINNIPSSLPAASRK